MASSCFVVAKNAYHKFRLTYHLEFHTFLFFLSSMIFSSAAYPLYYTKVCQSMYSRPDDPSEVYICDDFQKIQSDDAVQRSSTNWMMYGELAKFLPNILGTMFLGSYGDRYGRKSPTLIAIASFVIYLIMYWTIVTVPVLPLWAITLTAAVTSFSGTITVFLSSLFSEAADYLADNEQKLTVRYAILTAFWSGAIVIGGNAAPFMLTYLGVEWTMFIGFTATMCSFYSALFLFPAGCPATKERKLLLSVQSSTGSADDSSSDRQSSSTDNSAKSGNVPNVVEKKSATAWFYEGMALYKAAYKVLTKKRPNRGRTHLILYAMVVLIYACEDSGMDNITVLYIYYKPLSWSPQLYSWWSACMSLSQLVGSVSSAILFKKLKITDNTILMISVLSAALKMAGIGIGQYTWLMFASLLFGSLSTVGFSAIRSLAVQLGSPEETGELLSVINLSMTFCTLFSALVYNNIYSATLDFYPGFPWLLESALLFGCLLVLFSIRLDLIKNRKKEDAEIEAVKEIEKF